MGMAGEGRRRKPSIPEKLSEEEIQQQSFANKSFFIEKEISSIYCPKVLFYSSADWRIPPARLEVYTEKALLCFIAQLPLFFSGRRRKHKSDGDDEDEEGPFSSSSSSSSSSLHFPPHSLEEEEEEGIIDFQKRGRRDRGPLPLPSLPD